MFPHVHKGQLAAGMAVQIRGGCDGVRRMLGAIDSYKKVLRTPMIPN